MLILTFNILDTVGRYMGGVPKFLLPDKVVVIICLIRTIFIGTFILCALGTTPDSFFYNADWFKLINMILFAFTNGFISTQCAMKAPSRAREDSKEQVGTFIGTFLSTGILVGSVVAIGMGNILPKINS